MTQAVPATQPMILEVEVVDHEDRENIVTFPVVAWLLPPANEGPNHVCLYPMIVYPGEAAAVAVSGIDRLNRYMEAMGFKVMGFKVRPATLKTAPGLNYWG